jgi:hypothetical protein
LSGIEKYAFSRTGLIEIVLPSFVEILDAGADVDVDHFAQFHLIESRDCHELECGHSLALIGLS